MKLEELDYELPPELIAQQPVEPRDAARLLVCSGAASSGPLRLADRCFADLPKLLRPGDLLVRNNTRVLPARTFFRRPTGGRLEVLFLHAQPNVGEEDAAEGDAGAAGRAGDAATSWGAGMPAPQGGTWQAGERWQVLVRGRPRVGEQLTVADEGDWRLDVLEKLGDGRWLVQSEAPRGVAAMLQLHGAAPLPPYIRAPLADAERYQTLFARSPGSAAAPTAGLHFTHSLDEALAAAGVEVLELTLHVGLGTFKPLAADPVEHNVLHAESYELPAAAWQRVQRAKREGQRVVAVGTTSVRLLEHLALAAPASAGEREMLRGSTSLFITPGYRFRVVDALITNFHLPRTSLLALVMAFCGVGGTRELYAHAVRERYRFYTFGDAMLVE